MGLKSVTVLAVAGALLLQGCGGQRSETKLSQGSGVEARPASGAPKATDVQIATAKIREYCKACHAIGSLRFIRTDDDQQLWNELYTQRSPVTGKSWAEAIIKVLSWPSDAPPPFDPVMDPPNNRDWMPKGAKRLQLAEDSVAGRPVRGIIVDALKAGL